MFARVGTGVVYNYPVPRVLLIILGWVFIQEEIAAGWHGGGGGGPFIFI